MHFREEKSEIRKPVGTSQDKQISVLLSDKTGQKDQPYRSLLPLHG